jgi:hypothetical protein
MAISKIGGTGSDNWELISSATPTAASAAVNFTGLTPYKKLMVRWTGIVLSASNEVDVRLNNDSGNNYNFFYTRDDGQTRGGMVQSKIPFGPGTFTTNEGYVIFTSCDNTGLKFIENGLGMSGGTTGTTYCYYNGFYLTTSIITQVNVITDTTFTAAGTVALYGVK